jgi:hypothetical protein
MGGVVNFMPPSQNAGGQNSVQSQTSVPMFLCPSDLDPAAGWVGQNNYAGNQGGWLCDRNDNPPLPTDNAPTELQTGVFYYLSRVRASDVTDGLSNTVFFSEKVRGHGNPDPISDLYVIPHQTSLNATYQTCTAINPQTATPLTSKWGWSWVMGENCCTQYCHVSTPNTVSCAGTGFPGTMTNMAMQVSATSRHTGGVHCLLGDGAVNFASNSIDLNVWRAIGSRKSGEVVTNAF